MQWALLPAVGGLVLVFVAGTWLLTRGAAALAMAMRDLQEGGVGYKGQRQPSQEVGAGKLGRVGNGRVGGVGRVGWVGWVCEWGGVGVHSRVPG